MTNFNTKTGKEAVHNRWTKFHKKQIDYIKRNKKNYRKNLVKLHSYLASDGFVSSGKCKGTKARNSIIFYPDKKELADDFIKTFSYTYGLKPHIKELTNHYRIGLQNKIAIKELRKIGEFSSKSWRIPFKLISNQKDKLGWLSCFIDCDGHITKKGVIQIQSVNKYSIKDIQKLLKEFDVSSKFTTYKRKNKNWGINYILTIYKKEVIKIKNKLNLLHPIKKIRLKNAGIAQPGKALDYYK